MERFLYLVEPKMSYPVAIKAQNSYGVTGIPHAYLIDVDGKVVWEGSPASLTEKQVEQELRRVRRWGKVEGRLAAKAGGQLDKGNLGKAWTEARKILASEGAGESDRSSAEAIRDQVELVAKRRFAWADALAEEGRVSRALEVLEALEEAFAGTEWEGRARERRAELERDEETRALLEAERAVEKIRRRLKLPAGDKEREAALRALRKKARDLEGAGREALNRWIEIFEEKWVPKRT